MASRIIIGVNALARKLFDLRRRQIMRKLKYSAKVDALKAAFDADDNNYEAEIKEVKKQLLELIEAHTGELFTGVLKSFATVFAIVSRRTVNLKLKILDQKRAVKAARALRIFNEVCVVTVTVDAAMLEAHLSKHPEHRRRFGDSIQGATSYQSTSIKGNDTYFAEHDPNRLTGETIQLTDEPKPTKL